MCLEINVLLLWDVMMLWSTFVQRAVGKPSGGGKCDILGDAVLDPPLPVFPTLTMILWNDLPASGL